MNQSRYDSKNDPKQNAGQVPSAGAPGSDKGNGPVQTGDKGGAKPGVQAPGANPKGGQDGVDGGNASRDRSGSESMVNEGGGAHRSASGSDAKNAPAQGSAAGESSEAATKVST